MFEKVYGIINDEYVTGLGSQVRIWRSSNQLNVASDERFVLPHSTNYNLLSSGPLKTNVYQVDSPRTIATLKQQIINKISTILIKMLQ